MKSCLTVHGAADFKTLTAGTGSREAEVEPTVKAAVTEFFTGSINGAVAGLFKPFSWWFGVDQELKMVNNPEDDEILFTGFNQDATSLAVGTKRVYRLYSLGSVDELQKLHEQSLEDCCVVERLFSSSLVTLVSQTAPRKLRVCHFQKGTEICHQSYSNTILAVRLNRLRLVVCMEQSLYIHNIRDMKLLHTIRDTPPNPQGLCDLTSDDLSYFAYPGSSKIGEINIFDAANLQASATIAAHEGVLAALKFNKDGSKLASASEKGTVIRVFSVPQGEKLFEFRRGVKRCVTIYSLAFSSDSLFLSASSNTETVHVFKLEHAKDAIKHSSDPTHSQPSPTGSTTSASSWLPDIKGLVGSAATYLPSQMTDMWSQDRAFAVAKLPLSGTRNVTAITKIKQLFRVLVASADGYLYVYNLDTTLGGECSLIKQHCILTTNFSSQPTAVPSAGASTVAGLGGSPSSKFTYAATVKGPATPGSAIVSGTPGSASGDDCAVSRSPGKAVPVAVPASPSTTSSGRGPTSPLSRQADEAFSDLSLLEEPPSAFSASPLSGGFHSAAGQAAAGDGGRKRDAMPSVARSTPKSHLQKEIDLTRSSNRKTSSNSCDDFGPDANSNSRIRLDDNDEFPPMTHETQP